MKTPAECGHLSCPKPVSYHGGKFCSRSCANGAASAKAAKERREQYAKSPVRCARDGCAEPIPYKERTRQRYCSSRCSATHTQKDRGHRVGAGSGSTIRSAILRPCTGCGAQAPREICSSCARELKKQARWDLKRQQIEEGLVSNRPLLRRYLLEKSGHACHLCKRSEWTGHPIPLVLDHIDGHSTDNLPSNLRMICPNCDAQLPTYGIRNRGKGRADRRAKYREKKGQL